MYFSNKWIISFILGLALSICLFIVVDIAYNERVWEMGTYTINARLKAIAITTTSFVVISYIYRRLAASFVKKYKKINRNEYGTIFLISFIFINTMHIFIMFYINGVEHYRWGEATMVNIILLFMLFLQYSIIRNGILSEHYYKQNLQLEKVKVDQLETELKFLKSQYHPHFLFNALNTIYFQIDEQNKEAKKSIEQLADLLRYQLYTKEQLVSIEEEISYLSSYLAFQQLRMSNKLVLDLYFDPRLKQQKIHPLMFQPLIENAFKYVRGNYFIKIDLSLQIQQILFRIENSVVQNQNSITNRDKGIGIENLKRRLDLLYPGKYHLEIKQKTASFVVELSISIE